MPERSRRRRPRLVSCDHPGTRGRRPGWNVPAQVALEGVAAAGVLPRVVAQPVRFRWCQQFGLPGAVRLGDRKARTRSSRTSEPHGSEWGCCGFGVSATSKGAGVAIHLGDTEAEQCSDPRLAALRAPTRRERLRRHLTTGARTLPPTGRSPVAARPSARPGRGVAGGRRVA